MYLYTHTLDRTSYAKKHVWVFVCVCSYCQHFLDEVHRLLRTASSRIPSTSTDGWNIRTPIFQRHMKRFRDKLSTKKARLKCRDDAARNRSHNWLPLVANFNSTKMAFHLSSDSDILIPIPRSRNFATLFETM